MSAVILTQFPRAPLNVVVLYVVRFGVYLLFPQVEGVPGSTDNYWNISVVFVIGLGCSIIYYVECRLSRVLEEKKVADDFNFKTLGTTILHDAAPNSLSKVAEGTPDQRASHEQELLQAIRALTGEITTLRQSMGKDPGMRAA